MPEKQYLDANGNPTGATPPTYLDPNTGEPISGHPEHAPSVLDPKGGWNIGDVLRGAAAGVKNMVMHPIDTGIAMAQPLMASGMSPNGYPSTAATGRPQDSAANLQVQLQAQQGQADAAKFIGKNPAYTVGNVIGPAIVTAGAAKLAPKLAGVVARGAGSASEALYGTAMKPATTLSAADRAAMVRTGLDNSLPVSPAGVEKLGSLIDDLNQKIKGVIDTDPNRPIDPNAVATRADISKARFANQVNATKDLNDIEASRQQFLQERGAQPGSPAVPPKPMGVLDANGRPIMTGGKPATPPQPAPPMRAADAQAMKQGTYSVLRDKYGEQGAARVEAQKNLAMGLKEELASQFPELDSLNSAESKLLDLGPVLERAVNRVSNNHTIGIGGPILGSAIKAGTGSSGAAAVIGAMKSVVDIPMVKSRLAIALSKAAKIPYPEATARVAAYSASLGSALRGSPEYSSGDTPNQ